MLVCVGLFIYINDNKPLNLEHPQVMKCLLCYNAHVNVSNLRTHARKRLISYYQTNCITSLEKHVDDDHFLIYQKLEEIQNMMRGSVERQLNKKKSKSIWIFHINFFCWIH
jgi:hypothetical protein